MWRLKILGKIVMSRLPLGHAAFRRLGLFRHGAMNRPDYAIGVVLGHIEKLGGEAAVAARVCLELGPGDSLASAVIANALGARRVYLVDAGAYADRDMALYRDIATAMRDRGFPAADLSEVQSIDQMLDAVNAEYLTDGLASLRSIVAGSVDLIWSHAVLEHIRAHEIGPFCRELRRVIARTGRMSHRIDFMDHLGGALNNLRFSERVWESEFMVRSGFYTNRIRSAEMQRALRDAGFVLTAISAGKWDSLPTPRNRLAQPYRNCTEDDLLTSYIDVLAEPAPV
jgi:hypothetical protein